MKSSKKIIVAILIVLILLLIAGGAFAYVYVATDILKTDKELFFKYFAQITSEDGFIEKEIKDFNEKKKQTPYENSGEITFEVEYPDGLVDSTIVQKVNDLSIKYTGKTDTSNQKVEQNIEIDYGNDVIFPMNYKQDGNKFGLQIEKLSKQFIGIKNENLKEFAQKFGVEDVTQIPDEIELENTNINFEFTEDEKNQLKQIYGTVLQEQLLEDNFSSIKTATSDSYTLELSNEQIKNIVIKMLEKTKQNTLIIDKLNELIVSLDSESEEIEAGMIDDLIESINEEDISDMPNLKLTLVQNNKQLSQIITECGGSKIVITKNIAADSLSYEINCENTVIDEQENSDTESRTTTQQDTLFGTSSSTIADTGESIIESGRFNLYFNIQYSGLQNLSNVQENYEMGFDITAGGQTMRNTYKIADNTQFVDSVLIEELNDNVAVFLNDHNATQISTFLSQVGTKILEINKNQMTELGLQEYENPLLYSNPIMSLGIVIYNTALEAVDNTVDINEYQIQQFNEKFTRFESDSLSGSDVNAMIKTVQNHNLVQEDNTTSVQVTLDGNEITENQKVSIGKRYKVETVYGNSGFITEMQVTTLN